MQVQTRVESNWFPAQRLKLKYDKLPSSFAYKFNLRHYGLGSNDETHTDGALDVVFKVCEELNGRLDSPVPGLPEAGGLSRTSARPTLYRLTESSGRVCMSSNHPGGKPRCDPGSSACFQCPSCQGSAAAMLIPRLLALISHATAAVRRSALASINMVRSCVCTA